MFPSLHGKESALDATWGLESIITPSPQGGRACPEPFDFAFGYAQDRRSGAKSQEAGVRGT